MIGNTDLSLCYMQLVLSQVQRPHASRSQDILSLFLLLLSLLLLDPLCLKDVVDTHLLQRLVALQLCILQQ